MAQEYFTKKMFSICDKDGSQSISLQEFTETMGKLMRQSDNDEDMMKINRDKLHFLFKIYDEDSKLKLIHHIYHNYAIKLKIGHDF